MADVRQLPPRDLVMKGGITSGVVYPGAVAALAQHYRFRKVGGSSAGAIAAAVCAAAEYGRQTGRGTGMAQLEAVTRDLGRPGFLLGLFQPAPGVKPLWEILLALATKGSDPLSVVGMAFARSRVALFLPGGAVVVAAVVIALALVLGPPGAFAWVLLGALAALVLVLAFAAGAAWAVVRIVRGTLAALPESDFGFCPGSSQTGEPALVEWLHAQIQAAAGRGPDDKPLTFADLAEADIDLAMTTTDLSYARPVGVPLPDEAYLFESATMLKRFPRPVVAEMVRAAERLPAGAEPDLDDPAFHWMPGAGLPVIVGVRLSLSFPFLLSAMPLHAYWVDDPERVNLFSDGGICSNFPIHFFDAWFPRTPTWGLDLVDLPGYESGADATRPRVGDPDTVPPPRWREARGLGAFAGQIKDAMQNWRDALQSELPGFRDRVCQVPLAPGEGGLNLRMTPEQIAALSNRGAAAAEELRTRFDWARHRFDRYGILMSLLQENLHALADPSSLRGYLDELDTAGDERALRAAAATRELIDLAQEWGDDPADAVDFEQRPEPEPEPLMRVVPRA